MIFRMWLLGCSDWLLGVCFSESFLISCFFPIFSTKAMMQLKDAIQMFTFSEERAGLGLKFSPYALLWLEQWKNDLLANYLLTNKEKN